MESKAIFLNLSIKYKKIINEICEISKPLYPKKLLKYNKDFLSSRLFVVNLTSRYNKDITIDVATFYSMLSIFHEDEIEYKKGIPKNSIIVDKSVSKEDIIKINKSLTKLFELLIEFTDLMIHESSKFKDDEFCNFNDKSSLLKLYSIC